MAAKNYNGFTIIELMVTIAIAAILVAVAVPSMTNLYQNNQLRNYSWELVGAIASARTEAASRGESVTFESITANDWQDGWQIVLDSDNSVLTQGDGLPATSYSQALTNDDGATIYSFSIDGKGRRSGDGNYALVLNDGGGHTRTFIIPLYGSPILQ